MHNFWAGFEKEASVSKVLVEGLLGVGEITAENVVRRSGRAIRQAAVPVGAAGGTAALVTSSNKAKDIDKHE